jgi:hypothetical protein
MKTPAPQSVDLVIARPKREVTLWNNNLSRDSFNPSYDEGSVIRTFYGKVSIAGTAYNFIFKLLNSDSTPNGGPYMEATMEADGCSVCELSPFQPLGRHEFYDSCHGRTVVVEVKVW